MIFLLLAILSSASITLLMRTGSSRVKHRLGMLVMNYAACTVLSLLFTLSDLSLPADGGMIPALWIGGVTGVLYVLAFVLLQWNTMKNGVVLSSVFMKLGVLVPTVMSILVFHEVLGGLQLSGLLLALAAILLMNMTKDGGNAGSKLGLIALLLTGGLADGMSKVYEQLGTQSMQSRYLLFTFAAAGILCLIYMLTRKQKIGRQEIIWGVLVGIPNFFSARFLLQSLSTVPAVMAYPTFSVATIAAVSAGGMLIFKERPTGRQWIAIGMILAALVLLNL